MRDPHNKSLRREFLGIGLTGAMAGLAGCSDSVTIETGSADDTEETDTESDNTTEETSNQSPNLESVDLSFSYSEPEQQVTIEFAGGADIQAGNVRIQQGSETQVSWNELGSTTAASDQNISPGATAVLGENILNWGQTVAEDDLIRVVYFRRDSPATLERYSPPESTDSESTVPASISGFTLESSGEQQLQVSFDSSKQLGTIEVAITGAESATLARTNFTESASGNVTYTYSASYEASSDGSYSAEMTQAADTDGTNALNGENISDTASMNTQEQPSDTTPPSISAFSIANPSEKKLRVSFESNEELTSAQITISEPESVTLSLSDFTESEAQSGNFSYESTYTADSNGEFTATLEEAVDENGNDGANNSSVSVTIQTLDNFSRGWNTFGDATVAEIDGNDTLRLTQAKESQVGAGYYKESYPTTQGITVEFRYYAKEGSGGDGLAFLLLNESQVTTDSFSAGEAGGSLGYTGNPGITGGYLAVGFDEKGRFSATTPDRSDGPGENPQSITIRGAGNEAEGSSSDAYSHLITEDPSGGMDGGWRWARVTADPVGNTESIALRIEISYDDRNSWETVIDDQFAAGDIGSDIPEEFLFGFSGATGRATNIHAIESIAVSRES